MNSYYESFPVSFEKEDLTEKTGLTRTQIEEMYKKLAETVFPVWRNVELEVLFEIRDSTD